MSVEVYITREVGFFGPVLHSRPNCSDAAAEAEWITLQVREQELPLDGQWCCSKCGDMLWMTEAELVG